MCTVGSGRFGLTEINQRTRLHVVFGEVARLINYEDLDVVEVAVGGQGLGGNVVMTLLNVWILALAAVEGRSSAPTGSNSAFRKR